MKTLAKVALGPAPGGPVNFVISQGPEFGNGYRVAFDVGGGMGPSSVANVDAHQLAHLALTIAGLDEIQAVFRSMESMLGIVRNLEGREHPDAEMAAWGRQNFRCFECARENHLNGERLCLDGRCKCDCQRKEGR